MNRIRILTEKIASQIAAGEVIERPSSVLRELLDNSIDAEANKIFIKIKQGGKSLIRVSDNGIGMGKDDLLLCMERHATSKIRSTSDLLSIKSMGFRGEALPSISSVSRFEVTSRPAKLLVAHRIKTAGGRFISIEETGAPAGTTVEASDLFYNIPARKKFLRGVKTETDHIIETVTRISIPFPGIHFKLGDGKRSILNLPGTNSIINRLTILFGKEVASRLLESEEESDDIGIQAFLGPPELTRSKSDHIFFYINGRFIKDRMLMRAVMDGYGQRIMKGRYPQLVFLINVDPSLVDVNVHPTKQEVRFHQNQLVFKKIQAYTDSTLRNNLKSPFEIIDNKASDYSYSQEPDPFVPESIGVREPAPAQYSFPRKSYSSEAPVWVQDNFDKPNLRVIGHLKNCYILCQDKDGLIIFDQHAAHERIVYETLKRAYKTLKVESQQFLIPHRLEFSLKDSQVVLKNLEKFEKLGIALEHFGGNSFILNSIPSILVDVNLESFILELVPIIEKEDEVKADSALDKILTVMACHGAIRSGHNLSQKEMENLIDQLERMELPTNCPHGRPITKKVSYTELEKMFKRII